MISATASPPSGAGSAAALDCTVGPEPTTAGAASTRSVPARAPSRATVFAITTGAGAAISTTGKKTSAASSRRATQTRTSSGAGYASKTTTSANKDLAFLSDPKLSTEEKLFKFMAYMASKYDAEIEQKMKEVGGGTSSSTGTSSSSAPKKTGLFGGILGKVVKAAVPGAAFSLDLLKTKEVQGLLKTVSGPVLAAGATALGAPQLAPVLLKIGPDVANAVIGVAKSIDLDGGAAAPASSASSGSKASSTSSGSTTKNEQLQMMELQRLYEKQKEMMSLASNMLKGLHDMRMVAINNIGR
jgi:hypothetical protein